MEESQNFCLQWNSYQSSVTGLFDNLRRDGELVDVTLCAQGQAIKVHRMMLSACSPYFRDVLKGDLGTHPVFFMRDISFKDLTNIVEFMYRGRVNVAQSELGSFLKTAESLQVRGLTGDEDSAQQEPAQKPKPVPPSAPPPQAPQQHAHLSPDPPRSRLQPESPRQRPPLPPTLTQPLAVKRVHSPPSSVAPKSDGEGASKRARSVEGVEQDSMPVKQEPVTLDDGELSCLGGENSGGSGGLSFTVEEGAGPMGFMGSGPGHLQSTELQDEDLMAVMAGPSGFAHDLDSSSASGPLQQLTPAQPWSATVLPHQNLAKYACNYCGATFKENWLRRRHERTQHEQRDAFSCVICHRTFSRNDNLRCHMRTQHSGVF